MTRPSVILPERIVCPDWCAGGHDLDPAALGWAGCLMHNTRVATAPGAFTVEVSQTDVFADPSCNTPAHQEPHTIDVLVNAGGNGEELTTQQAADLAAALTAAVRLVEPSDPAG